MVEFYMATFIGGPLDGKRKIISRCDGWGFHREGVAYRYRKADHWSREYEQRYEYIGSMTDEEDIALLAKVLDAMMGDDDGS